MIKEVLDLSTSLRASFLHVKREANSMADSSAKKRGVRGLTMHFVWIFLSKCFLFFSCVFWFVGLCSCLQYLSLIPLLLF